MDKERPELQPEVCSTPTDAPVAEEQILPVETTEAPAEPAEVTAEQELPAEPTDTAAETPALDSYGRRLPRPYHERAYLRYGNATLSSPQDLSGTSAFLQGLGFDGGELRRAREGKDFSEVMKTVVNADAPMARCSYCGADIPGVDYHHLPDGRARCTTCSRTLVTTAEGLRAIYDDVRANLEAFFGATLSAPVRVEMLEERSLKRKLRRPLSEVDNKSLLILGVAVSKKGEYAVYLENGAPRLSVIATFVHELTHIWQYLHWDESALGKLSGGKRLLVYEGMAKWVEIQYLYLIGEVNAAKREEAFTRSRKDEYGIGFCLYEDRYPLSREAMNRIETPFRTDRYPIGD